MVLFPFSPAKRNKTCCTSGIFCVLVEVRNIKYSQPQRDVKSRKMYVFTTTTVCVAQYSLESQLCKFSHLDLKKSIPTSFTDFCTRAKASEITSEIPPESVVYSFESVKAKFSTYYSMIVNIYSWWVSYISRLTLLSRDALDDFFSVLLAFLCLSTIFTPFL